MVSQSGYSFPKVFTMVYSHEEVMNRLSIFNAWFIGRYMNESQTTIIALHIDNVQPRCRNQYPSNNNPIVPGIRPTFLAAILGAPELAVQVSSFIGFFGPVYRLDPRPTSIYLLMFQSVKSIISLLTGETKKLPVVVPF
jgi:hypothetical protein